MKQWIITLFIIICCNMCVVAQKTTTNSLRSTIATIDSAHKYLAPEKLYLHLDKPYYAIGDTLRFKAYLLDEALAAAQKSGLLYVELINDSSKVCKRQVIMVQNGMARGDIVIKTMWYAGNYTLRAYTNWMRNFGEEHFFTRSIHLVSAASRYLLANSRVDIDRDSTISILLQLSTLEHKNLGLTELQLSLLRGTKVLLKTKTITSPTGIATLRFNLPKGLNNEQLYLLAEDISKNGGGRKINIPINFNRPDKIDLQFMPEGGKLINEITTRVGFKAINETGEGVDLSGKILNSKQQEVANFKSTHKGMGNFELTPQAGEVYTAHITLADNRVKTYPLPLVNTSGISFRADTLNNDSLEITLSATPDLTTANNTYYLIGQARDKVCYGAGIVFRSGIVHKKIAENIFPTGIVKFVLLDACNQPITQRMVFIEHDDRLNIIVNSDKENYSLRDSTNLQLLVADNSGQPIAGSFSVVVTDDSRVKTFNEDGENIASNMLLNDDLKGDIEEAGYYFNKQHADRAKVLDDLLLTQGWINYNWNQLFTLPKLKYETETEFKVKGRVGDFFNLPVRGTEVMLISTNPQLLLSTKTDRKGRFTFNDFPLLDTINFHLQTRRDFNVGLTVNEFVPPGFTLIKKPTMPWYVNWDSTRVNYAVKQQALQEKLPELGKSKLLKEVIINGRRMPAPPPPVFTISEEEIRNSRTGEKPLDLLKLLMQYVKLHGYIINLIVDGKVANQYSPPYYTRALYLLYQYKTEDIRKMWVGKPIVNILPVYIISNAGIEGVQYGTQGYAYRPTPISWPHQFYSPRYTSSTPANVKDTRSTIYWAPDVRTDSTGRVAVSFYTATTPSTYTIIIEGTDLNGNIGYIRKKFKISPKITASK